MNEIWATARLLHPSSRECKVANDPQRQLSSIAVDPLKRRMKKFEKPKGVRASAAASRPSLVSTSSLWLGSWTVGRTDELACSQDRKKEGQNYDGQEVCQKCELQVASDFDRGLLSTDIAAGKRETHSVSLGGTRGPRTMERARSDWQRASMT